MEVTFSRGKVILISENIIFIAECEMYNSLQFGFNEIYNLFWLILLLLFFYVQLFNY